MTRRVRSAAADTNVTTSADGVNRSLGSGSGTTIVGIGASAGGLEALEQFFRGVPGATGIAFVIVQHLDPTQKGMMPELLQRVTDMKVVQVVDRTKVIPDHVYVIPPNKDMSILHGVLYLLDPTEPRGLRLPIDYFFRSLADDRRERTVCVILSGMGSDGTLGLRAVKEHAGLTLVQEPASAKFDGMPRSAIDAGLADIVALPAEIPSRILSYQHHSPMLSRSDRPAANLSEGSLEKIVLLLRTQTGHDFSLYKRNTVTRRVERRMGLHQVSDIATYVRYLRENPQEIEILFKELLIGVTSMFRDPEVWMQLRDEFLPALVARHKANSAIRAWVPGCSTGEEAYSLAIVIREVIERIEPRRNIPIQIFATDLDRDAVHVARQGRYPANISADVGPERLDRFFVSESGGFRVSKEIRECVIFAPQNLIMDPPFTKLDLLTCRNLLIYLTPELQKRLLPLFHYSLKPGGILLLGSAESIGGASNLFTPLSGKSRLFRRSEGPTGPGSKALHPDLIKVASTNSGDAVEPPRASVSLQSVAEQWVLKFHAPAAVLVDANGDIVFISGRTGRFLEPAAGKANWNVFAMVREDLRYELQRLFKNAREQGGSLTARNLGIDAGAGSRRVDLTVQFLEDPAPLKGFAMIVFSELPIAPTAKTGRMSKSKKGSGVVEDLQHQLHNAREAVQQTRQEMQASQEELKSMNEELQSTNEELQSTNEELTTSKEEMQSLNEELQTLNAELQAKVDELSATSNDMKNLLNSTEIAIVFLDNSLCVRRFTENATQIINLIPGDVGRPVTDLSCNLLYPDLSRDARDVLRTLIPIEKLLEDAKGRRFAMRLMPYRTLDDRIDGVVITFADMSIVQRLELQGRGG